jgi:uncharacterized membrane protein
MIRAGHAVFAATLIGLGVLGVVSGDFAPIWQPVPKGVPARELLVELCSVVPLAAGIGMLWPRTALHSARLLFACLLLWMLAFRLPGVIRAPVDQNSWSGLGEIAVYVAAAGVLSAARDRGVRIATILYALALIPFGTGHFVYAGETAALVPAWLPWHPVWAYFTGTAYIAAAVALIADRVARLAAVLAAVQMGVFTLLVWVPIVLAGPNAFQWSEFVISWTLTAAAWVLADARRTGVGPACRPTPPAC